MNLGICFHYIFLKLKCQAKLIKLIEKINEKNSEAK